MDSGKILFDGCSFTANSGFSVENQCVSHWPNLLSQHYQVEFDNNAIGGSSNNEIFNRVVGATTLNSYNLVLVQWTEISRQWIYCSNQNIDDFTIINAGNPKGHQCNTKEVQQYVKLHYTYFNNQYVNLKKWLCQVIALAGYLASKNQPYVFIKGNENYVSAFTHIEYVPGTGFKNLENSIKQFLDFDNRPDDYILGKIKEIQRLLNSARQLNWVNFDSLSFFDAKSDLADDKAHPGINSNLKFTKQLIAYCTTHDQPI
jgi:hypothetical protein